MAFSLRRPHAALQKAIQGVKQSRFVSVAATRVAQKPAWLAWGALGGGIVTSIILSSKVAHADEDALPLPQYKWDHLGVTQSFDTAALRRGFEVYRQVCSTCHSLELIKYRNLVGTIYTKEQAEALAKSAEIEDGPDDKGEMFTRPRILADPLPKPYPNDNFARYANNGSMPPDLSLMVKARHDGLNYMYALMTGYIDPPAGIEPRAGQYFNPYFPGGLIGMPPPLHSDGQVEYEDNTPATVPQMARDVTVFLHWAASPELDERKKMALTVVPALILATIFAGYYKRRVWQVVKNKRISWDLKLKVPPK